MTPPTKPKVVHVYESYGGLHAEGEKVRRPKAGLVYLGEYVPAPGPVVGERWEVRSPYLSYRAFASHDDARGHAKYQRRSGLSARIVHIVTRKKAK